MKDWKKLNMDAMMVEVYTKQHDLKSEVKDIKSDISTIKNNHLFHIEKDMSSMGTDISWTKKQIDKLDRKFWGVLIIGITTLIGIVVNTYLTLK